MIDEIKKSGVSAEWSADKRGHRGRISIDFVKLWDRFRPKSICDACGHESRRLIVGTDDIRRCLDCHEKRLKEKVGK